MKWLFEIGFATIIFFSANSFGRYEKPEGGTCIECSTQDMRKPWLFINAIQEVQNKMNWANKCSSFVNKKEIGDWGKAIRTAFLKTDEFVYLNKGTADIAKICPNYSMMQAPDKANFWVLVLNAMANYESSCNTKAKLTGAPNGVAIGLLQLHSNQEKQYTSLKGACANGDGVSPERTLHCALAMLDDQLRKSKKLFSAKSYWEVLRPQAEIGKAQKISSAVKMYDPCHDTQKLSTNNIELNNEEIYLALRKSSSTGQFDM